VHDDHGGNFVKQRAIYLAAALGLVTCCAMASTQPSQIDKEGHETLRTMRDASTWGHPDQFGQFSGMQLYAKGRYAAAMKYFRSGAWYADKFSQLSIGLMYLNGEGVEKDPVLAYAWVAVSAERKYPQFVATRNRLWAQMTDAQRARAKIAAADVAAKYGDSVAKPRMVHELEYWRTQITGSRTGNDSGVQQLDMARVDPGKASSCSARTIEGAPVSGCGGNIYDKSRWVPDQYFKWVDSQWTGTVTVGDLQKVGDAKAIPPAQQPESSKAIEH
jgi:hypothetical protein